MLEQWTVLEYGVPSVYIVYKSDAQRSDYDMSNAYTSTLKNQATRISPVDKRISIFLSASISFLVRLTSAVYTLGGRMMISPLAPCHHLCQTCHQTSIINIQAVPGITPLYVVDEPPDPVLDEPRSCSSATSNDSCSLLTFKPLYRGGGVSHSRPSISASSAWIR